MKPLADALAAALCAQSCAITLSSDSYATRAAPCPGTTALEVPIAIGAKRFGSIHICRSTTASGFDGDDLEYLGLIGWCIARTVESIRLQCTLGSHFAKFALAPAGGRSVEQIVAASAKHPDKTARLLARTFYRELARAGFTCNQIINAATEIISQLSIQLRQRKSSLGRVTNLSG